MLFKIDTKESYHIISTNFDKLDEIMAEGLSVFIKNNDFEPQNFIIDLSSVDQFDVKANNTILALHDLIYNHIGGSLVFTLLQDQVLQKFKQERLHLNINITPTLIEAIDIINMEVLERDLLGEEE